jgi:hypothetical protein
MTITRIYAHPLPRRKGAPGPTIYVAHLNTPDGPVVAKSRNGIIYAAARALLVKGITGRLEQWAESESNYRLAGNIERLSRWTIKETPSGGIREVNYVEEDVQRLRLWAQRTGSVCLNSLSLRLSGFLPWLCCNRDWLQRIEVGLIRGLPVKARMGSLEVVKAVDVSTD